MGKWRVTDADGMTVEVESEAEPTDEQLDAEFERHRSLFGQGSKAAMGVNPGAVKENVAASAVGAGLGLGGAALGAPGVVGGVARGGAGLLGGEALESMGAPKWVSEAAGLVGGFGGALKGVVKGGAKKLLAGTVDKAVENELKKRAVKTAVGETAKKSAPKAVDVIPGFDTTQLMQLKTAWSNKAGRDQIRAWVAQQAPETQKQIKQFLLSNAMR